MMNINFQEKSLIAAPFTPLHPDASLNTDLIPEYARFLEVNLVDGAFICGTTGEGPSLSLEEKKAVFAEWGKHKSETLKVIALVGGNCIPEARALALHAQNCNLDAISIIAPYYFPLKRTDELVNFCAAIAEVVPEVPLYYYHIPGLSRAFFPMKEFLTLAEHRIPNLVGIKFTHGDLMDFQACLNHPGKKFHMLWGRDEELLSALAIGAQGAVGSTYNYMSPVFRDLIRAFESGNLEQSATYQQKANTYIQILHKYGGIAPGKTFMKWIGMDCGAFRPPVGIIDEKTEQLIKMELEEAGFFDVCSTTQINP